MQTRQRIAPLVLLAFLVAGGCSNLPALRSGIQSPRVSLEDVHILSLNGPAPRYRLTLRIQNPNPMPLPGRGLDLSLTLGDDAEPVRAVSNASVPLAALGEVHPGLEVAGRPEWADLVDAYHRKNQAVHYRIEGRLFMANDIPSEAFSAEGVIGQAPVPDASSQKVDPLGGD
jgi:hypothetical protein